MMTHPDFSRIIYKLPEPLLLVELDGRVVAANSGASKLFRRRSSDLVGMPLIALIDDDTEKLTRYLSECSQTSGRVRLRLRIRRSNYQPIRCKVFGGLLREEQPRLVWLRLLPFNFLKSHSVTYDRRTKAREKDIVRKSRGQAEQNVGQKT